MPFKKGMTKHPNAGRKKGVANKKKYKKVADYLAEANLNPTEEILKLLEDPNLKARDRADIWMDLLSYCQAKAKDSPEDDMDSAEELLEQFENVTDATLLQLVKQPPEAT